MNKNWIEENININSMTAIAIIVGWLLGGFGAYYAMKYTGQTNTDQIEELNARVQKLTERVRAGDKSWDDLIMRLDERYVTQNQFDDFRNQLTIQLRYIREDTQYLRNKLDQQ